VTLITLLLKQIRTKLSTFSTNVYAGRCAGSRGAHGLQKNGGDARHGWQLGTADIEPTDFLNFQA
jgi:hypothetical protein